MLLWLQVVTNQKEAFGSGGGIMSQVLQPLLCANILVSVLLSRPEHWWTQYTSNFYSKRNTLKSETLIKLSSANLVNVRWAWFLNLNLKDTEAISCEPDPSLRDSVALISHSKQMMYPACCQSCVIEQSSFFFPPEIYFQNMLVIRSWCKYIFPFLRWLKWNALWGILLC